MVSWEELEEVGRRIGERYHPERVIAFGWHAPDRLNRQEEPILLVIMPFEGSASWQADDIRLKLCICLPVGLLVRTREMIERRLELQDTFYQHMLEQGQTLYAAPAVVDG